MTPNEVIGEFETLIRIAKFVDSDYCTSPFKIDFLQGAIDIIKTQEEKIAELQQIVRKARSFRRGMDSTKI